MSKTVCSFGHDLTDPTNVKIRKDGAIRCVRCHRNRTFLRRKGITAKHPDYEEVMRTRDPERQCSQGHARTPQNTIIRANGAKECIECRPTFFFGNQYTKIEDTDGLEELYGPIPPAESWEEMYDWVMVLRAAQGDPLPRPLSPLELQALDTYGLRVVA